MKVIDAMQKITNGEEFRFKILSENKTYHVYKDSQVFDEEDEDYVQWFIDYDWLNEEIEIIEEKLKPLEDLNLTRIDINKEGQVYGVTKKEIILDIQTLQHWVNKTIDAINEMREDK